MACSIYIPSIATLRSTRPTRGRLKPSPRVVDWIVDRRRSQADVVADVAPRVEQPSIRQETMAAAEYVVPGLSEGADGARGRVEQARIVAAHAAITWPHNDLAVEHEMHVNREERKVGSVLPLACGLLLCRGRIGRKEKQRGARKRGIWDEDLLHIGNLRGWIALLGGSEQNNVSGQLMLFNVLKISRGIVTFADADG